MSDVPMDAAAAPVASDRKATTFVAVMLAVTFLPVVLVYVLQDSIAAGDRGVVPGLSVLLLFGASHVAMSGYFWFDRRYRHHINSRPFASYLLPLLIVAASVAVVRQFGEDGLLLFSLFAGAWSLHHFGRQNWGMLCLAAAGTRSAPPDGVERLVAWLAPVTAIVAIILQTPRLAALDWAAPLLLLSLLHIVGYLFMMAALEGASATTMATATVLFAGITIWHFLIDADLWLLRQPFQRRALRESLPFLFR